MEIVATPTAVVKITSKYSKVVDQLTPNEFQSLKQSIKSNGLYHPITINGSGIVLDGHHRLRACRELGVPPRFETKEFENEILEQIFVHDINLARRHLTPFQKCALALAEEPLLKELAELGVNATQAQSAIESSATQVGRTFAEEAMDVFNNITNSIRNIMAIE